MPANRRCSREAKADAIKTAVFYFTEPNAPQAALANLGRGIGQKTCTAPSNVMTSFPRFDYADWEASAFVNEREFAGTTAWYQRFGVADIPAHVCSDGGEGSVRVPLQVPEQTYWNDDHKKEGLYHYDYICPYGSQPGVCPPRDLTLFQATPDELEQPSGPMFSDCHNPEIPDFECCRAEHAFRIRGGGGAVGNRSTEDESYCAYPEEQRSAGTYTHYDLRLGSGSTDIADWQVICPPADNYPLPNAESTDAGSLVRTHLECAEQCSTFFAPGERVLDSTGTPTATPQWIGDNVDCEAYSFRPNVDGDKGLCRLFKTYTGDLELTTSCTTTEVANWYVRNKPLLPDGAPCPLHWTSYHHTPTGCEVALHEAAFRPSASCWRSSPLAATAAAYDEGRPSSARPGCGCPRSRPALYHASTASPTPCASDSGALSV